MSKSLLDLSKFADSVGLTEESVAAEVAAKKPEYHQVRLAGPYEAQILTILSGLITTFVETVEAVDKANKGKKEPVVTLPEGVTADAVANHGKFLVEAMYNNAPWASFNKTYVDGQAIMEIKDRIDGHPRFLGNRGVVWLGNPAERFDPKDNPDGLKSIMVVSGAQGISPWLAIKVTNEMRSDAGLPPLQPRAPQGGRGSFRGRRRASTPGPSQGSEPERAAPSGEQPVPFSQG